MIASFWLLAVKYGFMVDQSPVSRTETGAPVGAAAGAPAELGAAAALDAPAELGAVAGLDAAAVFEAPAELLDAAGLLELEQDEITSANAANGNNHLSFINASRLLWLPAVIGVARLEKILISRRPVGGG